MARSASILICLLAAAATLPRLCNGFAPNQLAKRAAFAKSSKDHTDITEEGALVVLKDFLLANPNKEVDSTKVINSLGVHTARQLFAAYYHGKTSCWKFQKCNSITSEYSKAIKKIQDSNSAVDSDEDKIPEAHFDNEQIKKGNERLLEKLKTIIDNIKAGSYEDAQKETGRALHTLQDFYSHSNWVELGKTDPWEDLGRPDRELTNLAGEQDNTCTDCEKGAKVGKIYAKLGGEHIKVTHEYNCENNIVPDILSRKLVTTGYYGHTPEYKKPQGKCSHGGVGDPTSDFTPKGGINKDLKTNKFSPHHDLHEKAAEVAKKATTQFLQDIRKAVGDKAYGAFLNIDVKQARTSMAFVIDTASSMSEELSQIQTLISKIQQKLQADHQTSHGDGATHFMLIQSNGKGLLNRMGKN